jgi:hypothetical protein
LETDFRTPLPIPQKHLADSLLYLNKLLSKSPNIIRLEHIILNVKVKG